MKSVSTEKAPAAIGPYSQAIDTGETVYVSGQIPVNPETGEIPESIEDQAAQSFTNLRNILESAGLSIGNVAKTTVFITDMNDFAKVNEVYSEFFKEPYPARSCVQVSALPKGVRIETECIAVR